MERRTRLEEMAAGTSMPGAEPSSRDRIGLAGGDDEVTRVQLAARWAEAFAPGEGDALPAMLKRFRQAFEYLDAVIHGVEPAAMNDDERAEGTR